MFERTQREEVVEPPVNAIADSVRVRDGHRRCRTMAIDRFRACNPMASLLLRDARICRCPAKPGRANQAERVPYPPLESSASNIGTTVKYGTSLVLADPLESRAGVVVCYMIGDRNIDRDKLRTRRHVVCTIRCK